MYQNKTRTAQKSLPFIVIHSILWTCRAIKRADNFASEIQFIIYVNIHVSFKNVYSALVVCAINMFSVVQTLLANDPVEGKATKWLRKFICRKVGQVCMYTGWRVKLHIHLFTYLFIYLLLIYLLIYLFN